MSLSYGNVVRLLNGSVSLSANVEQVLGSTSFRISPGLYDPNASLARQAGELEALANGGYYRKTDFVRFRELSVSYNVKPTLLRLLRVRNATIIAAAQNIGLWTNYSGRDPNVSMYNSDNDTNGDTGALLAQPRNWNFRVHLGF